MHPTRLSIVIASGAGGEFLFRCLESLRVPCLARGVPILVADRCGEEVRRRIAREHPHVRVLAPDLGHRPSVPELRREGVLAAESEVVAVIEEHCTAPDGWVEAVDGNFADGDAAIGGPILDDGFRRVRDWVVYFSEYHDYLPPWPPGDRAVLNGANIAYRRELLLRHRDVLDRGYWEVVLHPLLASEGRLRAVPGMGARHTGPFDYAYYLGQRFLLSRVWGGSRKDSVSFAVRAAHVLLTPVFPLFLFAKVTRRVLANGTLTGRYLAALPLLVPAWCAYSLGEGLGYLLGPGDALERVE